MPHFSAMKDDDISEKVVLDALAEEVTLFFSDFSG